MIISRGTIYGTNREVQDYVKQYIPVKEIQLGNYPCPYFGKSKCDKDCTFCMKPNDEYDGDKTEVCVARKRYA
jgi:hypothetical protein